MQTIKTVLHTYDTTTDDPGYQRLRNKLERTPGRGPFMNAWGGVGKGTPAHEIPPGPVELETDCLFENQWNTVSGYRVFDWYEEYPAIIPKNVRRGHYLDITEEMIRIRKETLVDGWSGNFFPASSGLKFNTLPSAIGSPYLKETELNLLRLLPVCDRHAERAPLTADERAFLLPLYTQAQTKIREELKAKKILEIRSDLAQKLKTANMEHDGFLWLLDHDVNTENCIFYSHTGQFSFGWRSPIDGEARTALLESLRQFPFPWDVK